MYAYQFVDLVAAKRHLRIVGNAEDEYLVEKIQQASSIVANYLKVSPLASSPLEVVTVEELWPNAVDQGSVRFATLLVLGDMYTDREGAASKGIAQSVKDLVHRLRDPALA